MPLPLGLVFRGATWRSHRERAVRRRRTPSLSIVADAHLDHHFFQIATPRLGARPSLGSLAHLEGDRLTEASLKLLFTSMLSADGKETDYEG